MRKLLLAAAFAAAMLAGTASLAPAHATSTCKNANGTPTVGTSGVQICITQGPVQGTVTASGDPAAQQGYVVADGSPSNPGALGGYVGIDSANGGEIVACSGQGTTTDQDGVTHYDGDYKPGAGTPADGSGNNAVVTAGGTVNLPGSGGGCDVKQ